MMSIIGNTVTNVEIMSFDPGRLPCVHLQVSLLYALTLNSTSSQWSGCHSIKGISSKEHWVHSDGCHEAIIVHKMQSYWMVIITSFCSDCNVSGTCAYTLIACQKLSEQCRSDQVRLLAENKDMLGVMFLDEAIDAAESEGLDVVLVSPDADPPVCRLMDASKHKYELEKQDKESKKKQREAR